MGTSFGSTDVKLVIDDSNLYIIPTSKNTIGIWSHYDQPFNTIEKDNSKILQYKALGLSHVDLTVEKDFINKSKLLYLTVKGKVKSSYFNTEYVINIRLEIDYNIYDDICYYINDGILTVTLHEIINEEPKITLFGK